MEENKILKEGWVDVPISMLVKATWNYKTDDVAKAIRLKNKIAKRGAIVNIIIRLLPNGKYESVNGNHRLDAYKELNMQAAHAYNMGVISDEMAKLIAVETNDHDDFESDPNKLKVTIDEIKAEFKDWDLTIPDFEFIETDPDKPKASEDNFEIPEIPIPDVKFGDLIQIGPHLLLCGDSTKHQNWELLLGDREIDLVVTDPPYNVSYEGGTSEKLTIENDKMKDAEFYEFLLSFYIAIASKTKRGGAFYIWHASSEIVNFAKAFKDAGLLLKQQLVWVKQHLVLGRRDYQWKHEPCLYGWKDGAAHYFVNERSNTTVIEEIESMTDFEKMSKKDLLKFIKKITAEILPNTVLNANKPNRNGIHPTMKPVLLIAPQIEKSSRIGEIVADGFSGSGTTMVAAHQLNRICVAIEYDPKYCDANIQRMVLLDPTMDIIVNGENKTQFWIDKANQPESITKNNHGRATDRI
jgi:site-specific DNA-methyltransferase (adenine-specific)